METAIYLSEETIAKFFTLKLGKVVLSEYSIRSEKGCENENINVFEIIVCLINKVDDLFKVFKPKPEEDIKVYYVQNVDSEIYEFEVSFFIENDLGYMICIPQSFLNNFKESPVQELFRIVILLRSINKCLVYFKTYQRLPSISLEKNFKTQVKLSYLPTFIERYNRIPWSPPET